MAAGGALTRPVLVVHGLWDTPEGIAPLTDGIRSRGFDNVVAMGLTPSDGRVSIRVLARQVAAAMNDLAKSAAVDSINVVGFSMGALTTRACLLLERASIVPNVHRFISISGPHRGSFNAYALSPLDYPGVGDMRPRSPFLRALEAAGPIAGVDVHCLYTPFDLMVTPSWSAILEGAKTVKRIAVPYHRRMIEDARSLDHIASLLR